VAQLQQQCIHNGGGEGRILLIGVFGATPYLQVKLQQACPGVELVCPSWGRAATMIGESRQGG
jgi:hypothetical protein